MSEPKRYRIRGKLEAIVNETLKDRERFIGDVRNLCLKYNFESYSYFHADIASGMRFNGFCEPTGEVDRKLFKAPTKQGVYYPYVKHKEILKDIKSVKDWSLKDIWNYIDASPHPFGGNMGIYQDDKLNKETLFFSYNEAFKGHEDLEEIKKSEYYSLIGE